MSIVKRLRGEIADRETQIEEIQNSCTHPDPPRTKRKQLRRSPFTTKTKSADSQAPNTARPST